MRTIASILAIAVTLTALPGCGGSEEPAGGEQASAPSAPILGGQRSQPASGGQTATAPKADVAFDDSSAEAAVATYVNRYMAGDFQGALEICDMSSEGAQQLAKQIEGFQKAQESGVQIDLSTFLVQGLEGIRWERVEDKSTDERVEFNLIVPTRPKNKTCAAVLIDGAWRVQPDSSGNP